MKHSPATGEIRVDARVANVTKAETDSEGITTFQSGDALSLYVWTGSNDTVPENLTVNGEVNTFDGNSWLPANKMLWKNFTDAHYFLGVYPTRKITNFTADSFEQTLSAEKFEDNDLMVATILGDGVCATETSSAPVPLVFDHLMAKFNVSLTFRSQWGGIPENVSVSVKAAMTGTIDYLSKTVTPGNDIADLSFINGAGENHSTLIIPQEGVKEITVTVNGSKYVYTHPTSIPLTKGHVTTLPLIVGKDAIVLADEGITIEAWTAGELPEGLGGNTTATKLVDLATLKADYIVTNNTILTGTLDVENHPVKISIADGATVTFDGLTINGVNNANYKWAGITCVGDATIILKEGSVNSVMGFYQTAPGIFIPEGKTLVIKGEGSLTASNYTTDLGNKNGYGYGAGIGGGQDVSCGNIEIQGGNITAYGGKDSAGIGGGGRYKMGSNCGTITISGGTVVASSIYMGAGIGTGYGATCGIITISEGTVTATGGYGSTGIGSALGAANCSDISISGGTVTATGGYGSAGIGSGLESSCGTITIASTVTKVTAVKGDTATNCIGASNNGTCGTVTIGGVEGAITESPYVYPLPYPIDLSEVTSAYVGSVITDQYQRIYKTVADAAAAGEVAVAIIAYVGAAGSVEESDANFKGLAIALSDADGDMCTWADPNDGIDDCLPLSQTEDITTALGFINGKTCTETLNNPYHTDHNHVAASFAKENKDTPRPDAASDWFLPSMGQWNLILQGLAKKADNITDSADNNYYKAGNLNSVITAAGGEGFRANDYWTSSENLMTLAWIIDLSAGSASYTHKGNDCYVRSAFAF